jgi:putative zinc finger protein
MSDHELLPWQLNGTLTPEERARFEEHLPGCSRCTAEIEFLRRLQEQIRIHGEAFFSAHPTADTIVAGALKELDGPQAAELRRHLDVCATCTTEIQIIQEGQRSIGGGSAASLLRGRGWRRALPWAVVAGAVLAILIPLWQKLQPSLPRSGPISATYLEPPQRAGGVNRVEVAQGAALFQLVIPVDRDEKGAPISLEIHDSSGKMILGRGPLKDFYRDRFLLVLCERSEFPDGDYTVTLRGPAAAEIEIPFQVRSQPQK